MKILIITYYFPPLNSVASLRPYSFARTFVDAEHDVTVLTTTKPRSPAPLTKNTEGIEVVTVDSTPLNYVYKRFSSYRKGKSEPSKRKPLLRKMIDYIRIRRGILFLGRMPDILDVLIRPWTKWTNGRHWDLVLSTYAPYACHEVAFRIKKSGLCRYWVADFRDLWTDNHHYSGVFPFTIAERRLEQKYLQSADIVTTVSKPLAAILQNKIDSSKVHVVANGYDPQEHLELDQAYAFDSEKLHLVYTGTIYHGNQNFSALIEALHLLKKSRKDLATELQVIFAGDDLNHLQNKVHSLDLETIVCFTGVVDRELSLRMQRDADILLFFDFEGMKGISTGKIYEYVVSGTYIWRIGSDEESTALHIINETESGRNIGNNPQLIYRQLVELLKGSETTLRQQACKYFDRYTRNREARKILELIRNIEV